MATRIGFGIALLADPLRLRIIGLIALAPRRPSVIASELGITRPAATRHLNLLRDAGLIVARRPMLDRRRIVYSIDPLRQGAIMAWLAGTRIGVDDGLPIRAEPADPKVDISSRGEPRLRRGRRYS
jgi:DNA-binding transcriptional ArsR family regulator